MLRSIPVRSSRCIWLLRSKCPAAKALAKRMASGGVIREPALLKMTKTIKTCKRPQDATRYHKVLEGITWCKRCAEDVMPQATAQDHQCPARLLPYRSVHRCGGPTWHLPAASPLGVHPSLLTKCRKEITRLRFVTIAALICFCSGLQLV